MFDAKKIRKEQSQRDWTLFKFYIMFDKFIINYTVKKYIF